MSTKSWVIDGSHSELGFVVRHMVVAKVRGSFTRWSGSFTLDAEDPGASRVEIDVDTASVDTREPKRDAHLRSSDFFDVEKFPRMTFRSTEVGRTSDGWSVVGELSLHGVTRPVTVEVEALGGGKDPWGNERIAFAVKARINRTHYGLGWNQLLEAGGVLVGENVDIVADVQAVPRAEARAA